uniref:NR LBD domain-containing protein n=1 Tax=Syphacia muris TaxID=451379 RepID=A0A0N5AMF9_9BILA
MWTAYPGVTLPPPLPLPPPAPPPTFPSLQARLSTIRGQAESMYTVTPLTVFSHQLSAPILLPIQHPSLFSQMQTDIAAFCANGFVIGAHIPLSPRNKNISTSPLFVQVPALSTLSFQRSLLEIVHPPLSNNIHSVCHGAISLTFPVSVPVKSDASFMLFSPVSVPLNISSCNSNLPVTSQTYTTVPTSVHGAVDAPDLIPNNQIGTTTLSSSSAQSASNMIPAQKQTRSFLGVNKTDYENFQFLQQRDSIYTTFQNGMKTNEVEVSNHCCYPSITMTDNEETSERVPLYERIGDHTWNLLRTELNGSISCDCFKDISANTTEMKDSGCHCLPFLHSPYSTNSESNSFYSSTNTDSSSFATQSSPLYSMINNVDDLKRAARGEGAEQLITISSDFVNFNKISMFILACSKCIEDCNLPKRRLPDISVENKGNLSLGKLLAYSTLGGLYFCGVPRFDLYAQKSATLKENMEKVVVDMVASGLKFAVLAIRRREENLLQNFSTSYEII